MADRPRVAGGERNAWSVGRRSRHRSCICGPAPADGNWTGKPAAFEWNFARWLVRSELLVESVTLGLLGGAVGIGVAYVGLRLLTAIGPANLPRLSEISLDGWSLAFTLILSVLSGLLFGSIPVLRYAPSRQAVPLLGGIRTASAGRERQRGRNLLVVVQVAMALVLLISAVLMIRTFAAMRNVDPGF